MIDPITEKLLEVFGVVLLHRTVEHIVTDRRALASALTHTVWKRSRRLRVSMSSILSIQVGDKYVLIQNARRGDRWTPIGGVVRFFPSSTAVLEGSLGFEPEFNKGPEHYDLRGFIRGKNFAAFLRWYAAGAAREQNTLSRELEEEFKEIGLRGADRFMRHLEFVHERVVHEGPARVRSRDYWQYRCLEVYSLREESEPSRQFAKFIRAQALKNRRLQLVDKDDIRRGKINGLWIGDSAGYLFSNTSVGVPAPPLF